MVLPARTGSACVSRFHRPASALGTITTRIHTPGLFVVVVAVLIEVQFSRPKHQGTGRSFGQVLSSAPVQISTLKKAEGRYQTEKQLSFSCGFVCPGFQLLPQRSAGCAVYSEGVEMLKEGDVMCHGEVVLPGGCGFRGS